MSSQGLWSGHDRGDLALARGNQAKSGLTNVEFLKGDNQHIPLPDNSVNVVISYCVINPAADKAVIIEAFRVLKPGGRFAVADVVVRGDDVPSELSRRMELRVGCVAEALEDLPKASCRVRASTQSMSNRLGSIASPMPSKFSAEAGLSDDATI